MLEAREPEGVVLRFGWFYGPGTYYDRGGTIAEDTLKRRNPVVGSGDGNLLLRPHRRRGERAYVAALDHGAPGVYNVVDDEPAPLHEWLPAYAQALGAKPPRRVPAWLARLVAGKDLASAALEMRGACQRQGQARAGLAAGASRAGARASRRLLLCLGCPP